MEHANGAPRGEPETVSLDDLRRSIQLLNSRGLSDAATHEALAIFGAINAEALAKERDTAMAERDELARRVEELEALATKAG